MLRCHLGLIVPEGCGMRVDTETRNWTQGKCLRFNHTLEHEAWNKGNSTIVLLLDFKATEGLLGLPQLQQGQGFLSIFGFLKGKKR